MAVDPIDISRDEARRIDNRKSQEKKDIPDRRGGLDFSARYQSKLKAKESGDLQRQDLEKAKEEGDLFSKVLQAFRGQEDGKNQDKKDSNKKDDLKKEKFHEEDSSDSRTQSVAQDGHARVASKSSGHQEGGSGSGAGGGSDHNHGGSKDQSMGGQKGSGFSGGENEGEKNKKGLFHRTNKQVSIGDSSLRDSAPCFQVGSTKGSLEKEGDSSSGERFSQQILNEVVEFVKVALNEEGDKVMEVQLTDNFFSGLKVMVSRSSSGMQISFVCPNRPVKELFLIHRPQIYSRLKEKNIKISRIEVT